MMKTSFAVILGVPAAGAPPELLAATDYATGIPTGIELVALQATAGFAPAWQAIQDRTTIQVDDLTVDPRWQPYGATPGAGLAFRSVLAFCLLLDGATRRVVGHVQPRTAGVHPGPDGVGGDFR